MTVGYHPGVSETPEAAPRIISLVYSSSSGRVYSNTGRPAEPYRG